MPLLGGLLVSLFSGLATFLTQFVAQKVAVGLAAAATLGVLIGGLILVMRTLVSPLLAVLFDNAYGQLFGLFIPSMAGECLTAYAACWGACTLYSWQKKSLELFVQA